MNLIWGIPVKIHTSMKKGLFPPYISDNEKSSLDQSLIVLITQQRSNYLSVPRMEVDDEKSTVACSSPLRFVLSSSSDRACLSSTGSCRRGC